LSQRALQSVHIDILNFDLTSDQEKLPNNPSLGKRGRNLQESNRGGSLSRMDRTIDVMCTEGIIIHTLKHSNNTINEYDRVYE